MEKQVKTVFRRFIVPSLRAAALSLVLVLAFTYALLDAFVIPKALPVPSQPPAAVPSHSDPEAGRVTEYPVSSDDTPSPDISVPDSGPGSGQSPTPTILAPGIALPDEPLPPSAPVITETSYEDRNIRINIEYVSESSLVYYTADVRISNISFLRTAFANDTYGRNITQRTSQMAEQSNAILAISGDYYGFRGEGLVIRNGVLYRNPMNNRSHEGLIIDANGDLTVIREGEFTGEGLMADGIWQGFSFGPGLVIDGINVRNPGGSSHPRAAIGQISPLHYVFIVVDGRTATSRGLTLFDLAEVFISLGCHTAYNLDGGGSASMWFNGRVVNAPTADGVRFAERRISDIVYIGTWHDE